jgi:hypothetical protein
VTSRLGALAVFGFLASLGCGRRAREEGKGVSGVPSELAKKKPEAPGCDASLCDGQCIDLASNAERCGACDHACASGEGCAAGLCAKLVTWPENAFAGSPTACPAGERRAVRCPARPAGVTVWGSDEYTADSSVCEAALHSGRVTALGGSVAYDLRPGAAAYVGTLRNGVTTQSWGPFSCGFVFVSGCASGLASCGEKGCAALETDERNCGECGRACGTDESCRAGTCVRGHAIDFTVNATAVACTPGLVRTFDCPPLGAATVGTVWGTDVYTHDSPICAAAIHAGAIGAVSGGKATIEMMPGQPSYKGSLRNGITSTSYAAWTCSYRFK